MIAILVVVGGAAVAGLLWALGYLWARVRRQEEMMVLCVVTLPHLLHELMSHREKRRVAPTLVQMVDAIFEPAQVCIFYRSALQDNFKLTASRGLPVEAQGPAPKVAPLEGPIGWVARYQRVVKAEVIPPELVAGEETAFDGKRADFYAPIVDPDDQSTLGVIALRGVTKNERHMKGMVQMVADLGALALRNTDYYRRIRAQANQDGLTQLFTKQYGLEQLSLAVQQAKQSKRELSVFMFDVDHFKAYNDSNGHLAGDEVLREIGRLVRGAIRADDFALRFGGEEFVVVFLDADTEGGLRAGEKLRRLVAEHPFPLEERQPGGRLTISGGIASLRADSSNSLDLIRLADRALYESKKAGRNRVLPYHETSVSGDPGPAPLPLLEGQELPPVA